MLNIIMNFLTLNMIIIPILLFFFLIPATLLLRYLFTKLGLLICKSYYKFVRITSPPLPHPFIKITLRSALDHIALAASAVSGVIIGSSSLITIIVLSSGFLFSAAIYIAMNRYSTHLAIFIPVFVYLLEHIVQNTEQLYILTSTYLANPELSVTSFAELHQYLTPFIRTYHYISELTLGITIRFDMSMDTFEFIRGLEARLRESGNNLLGLYRHIEDILGISLENSPISNIRRF